MRAHTAAWTRYPLGSAIQARLRYLVDALAEGVPRAVLVGGTLTLVLGGSALGALGKLPSAGLVLIAVLVIVILILIEGGHRLQAKANDERDRFAKCVDTEARLRKRRLRTAVLPMLNELQYIRELLGEATDQNAYWWAAHGIPLPQSTWNEGGKQTLGEEAEESAAARAAYARAEDAFHSVHRLNLIIIRRAGRFTGTVAPGAENAPAVHPQDGLAERLHKIDKAVTALADLVPEPVG